MNKGAHYKRSRVGDDRYFTGSDPVTCITFACNRQLTLIEQLAGKFCTECSQRVVPMDITLFIKVP